jgi:hypothetical protein
LKVFEQRKSFFFKSSFWNRSKNFALIRPMFKSWLKCLSHSKPRMLQTSLILFWRCSWVTWRSFFTVFY